MMKLFKRYLLYLVIPLLGCFYWIVFSPANVNRKFQEPNPKTADKITIIRTIKLPDLLVETSGLIYYKGLIWTFNDSGGEPELYSYSIEDSALVQRITLWKGTNYDWEEVTQDSSSIYIGDFGNNFGMRNNLCIYKIDKNDLPKKGSNGAVRAVKIQFTYPDYHPVTFSLHTRSAFDCEAMICVHDSLYLFTKNWVNQTSSIYQLPNKHGRYIAKKIGEFNSRGLVTASTYYKGTLYLLGYANFVPFLWKFENTHHFDLKNETGQRFDLMPLTGSQTEGIAMFNDSTMLISAEKTLVAPQLFILRISH